MSHRSTDPLHHLQCTTSTAFPSSHLAIPLTRTPVTCKSCQMVYIGQPGWRIFNKRLGSRSFERCYPPKKTLLPGFNIVIFNASRPTYITSADYVNVLTADLHLKLDLSLFTSDTQRLPTDNTTPHFLFELRIVSSCS